MRGAGPRPYIYRITRGPRARFLGLGLSVSEAEDLETLAKAFGSRVERAGGPGGGFVVRLRDPQGIEVEVLAWNDAKHAFAGSSADPAQRTRTHIVRVNDTQRPMFEPPQVTKLGHLVLETPDFDTSVRWYIDTFRLHSVRCDVPARRYADRLLHAFGSWR